MSKSSPTVRDVFELPEPGAEGSANWKTLQERVKKEVKGIKTAAVADMAGKVAELFEIPIPDIFLTSWKKAGGVQDLLAESRKDPEAVLNAELGEHTINSQHKPHIEIRIQSKAVKKIQFTLKLIFSLKGFVLKIQDGKIRGMQTGICEVKGKMEYEGLVIAEKKLAPIVLPGVIDFDRKHDEADLGPIEKKVDPVEEKAAAVTLRDSEPSNLIGSVAEKSAIGEESASIQDAVEPLTLPPEPIAVAGPAEFDPTPLLDELPGFETPQTGLPDASTELVSEIETGEPNVLNAQGNDVFPETEGELPADEAVETAIKSSEPEEVEERMTWEVGDDEVIESHREGQPGGSETFSAALETDENADDVIARMSRELADSQQASRTTDETNDRA